MRKLFSFLVLTVVFGIAWQVNAQANQPIKLKINEQKAVDKNISIKFVAVLNDSRCPVDVDCVWAGNAKLRIALIKRSTTKMFEINTGLAPQNVKFGSYEIKILTLEPRRQTTSKADFTGYVATFSITNKK